MSDMETRERRRRKMKTENRKHRRPKSAGRPRRAMKGSDQYPGLPYKWGETE
jgi:hypothetical protein